MAKRAPQGNPKIAIAYVRCSTDRQERSPERQSAAIEAWAAREGLQLVACFVERDVSGAAPLARRPALLEAISALSQHHAGALVMSDRSRLARDAAAARAIEGQAKKAGAQVRTADGSSDHSGSQGIIAKGVPDLFAEYERAVIRERVTAGMAVKRARNEWLGQAPYGQRVAADGVHLEPDPEEQATISLARQLRAEGLSTRAIVRSLGERGIAGRTGKPLGVTQVHRIIAL